ncbi:hypothetical protein Tco_0453258 [Tanacetum coccineum]
MASEHSSSRPVLHEITPITINSGLMPNPPPSTPFVPPSKTDWDILFEPVFDELLNPSSRFNHPTPEVIALIVKVVAPEPAASTSSHSSTTIDQDAPLPNVAHMNNDPFFGIPIPKDVSKASSSSDVIPTIVHTAAPHSEHITKWSRSSLTTSSVKSKDLFPQDSNFMNKPYFIEAMQEELNEFERLKVWETLP